MNRMSQSKKNRLSLRQPEADSLNILAELVDMLPLKECNDLPTELEKVKGR